MPSEARHYAIRVRGEISPAWSEWFDGLAVTPTGEGDTILAGWLADQSALYGVLTRLHALNLPLIAVASEPP